MRILELHLEVADLQRSLYLYCRLLPHRSVTNWPDGSAAALVLEDGSALGLWVKGKSGIHGGRGGEHVHFAFQIEPSKYESWREKIERVGLAPLEHLWPNGHRSVYFFDYDGHQGEFMTVDWKGEPKLSTSELSP